jgi:hypothetical protein
MKMAATSADSPSRTARLRLVVLGIAVLATAFKLWVAAHTFGTNDVHSWYSFAEGVRLFGPVDMYGHPYFSLYNHPPLSGRMLVAINWLVDRDVANFLFLIKVPAVLADLVMAWLVFELVRLRRPVIEATVAAALVVCSPVLVVISGFHGNTDPLFVMFALLSVYLLVVKRWAAAAGVAFALSLSVKLIPIVLVPMLLVILVRLGVRKLLTFTAGGVVVFALLWGPVILNRWTEFSRDVIGYKGIWAREWGLNQFLVWAEAPTGVTEWLIGPGRFVVLALCALLPAYIAWRRPVVFSPAAAGLALAMFLLLSPAFGMQYLVWPLAALYFINFWAATVYNIAASTFALVVYTYWNSAPIGEWWEGKGQLFREQDTVLMVITWSTLAIAMIVGLFLLRRRNSDSRYESDGGDDSDGGETPDTPPPSGNDGRPGDDRHQIGSEHSVETAG